MADRGRDWALITGASSGIGRALARQLVRRGLAVILTGRSRQRLDEIDRECQRLAPSVRVAADLAQPAERANLAAEALAALGESDRLRFVVHCAGSGDPAPGFDELPVAALEQAMSINVTAALDLTQRLLVRMSEVPASRLLLVGAGIADRAQPGTGAYGISKQALARLFEQMLVDFDYAGDPNRPDLALFQPGLVDTEGLRDHVTKAASCRLPHARWLQARLDAGEALTAAQAAAAMARALLELDRAHFHGQTLHARELSELSS